MKWAEYANSFSTTARQNGYPENEIEGYLKYANQLYSRKLPIIYDQTHFCLLVGYKEEFIFKVSNSQKHFYRSFKIPKKSHGFREISEPLPSLKEMQNWILHQILDNCKTSSYAKAYVKGRSIKENAKFHLNQQVLLTLDIENFFGSIKFQRILEFYLSLGYSKPVSVLLSNLCCLNGSLPQGAPTSASLSNLILLSFDKDVSSFCKDHDIHYTRYADDMTFSGNFSPSLIIKFVKEQLLTLHLHLNQEKIRVRKPHQCQEVTGIVVNNKLQVPRNIRRKLRQDVYYISKYGLASHLERKEISKANNIFHLMGIANFILFVNPLDEEAKNALIVLRQFISTDDIN